MRLLFCIIQVCILTGLIAGCSKSSFSGRNSTNRVGANKNVSGDDNASATSIVRVPGEAESILPPEGSPSVVPKTDSVTAIFKSGNGPLNLEFEPGNNVKVEGGKVLLPLNLYVALDVTGSMEKSIQTLKDNINAFSDRLKEKGFKVRLGLIPFRDEIVSTLDLTDDIEVFKDKVSKEKAEGGAGSWEASLMAVGHAVDRLQALTKTDEANVVLVISDNPGHYGDNENDCSIDGLVKKLNGLSVDFQKSLRLYGSIDKGTKACNQEYSNGKSQWDKVLEVSLTGSEQALRGGRLSYPFEGSVILDEFVKSLVKTLPGSDNICLATKASLKESSTELGGWPAEALPVVYEKHVKSEKILWKNVVSEPVYKTLVGKTLNFEVTRCCADSVKAAKGDFSGCKEQVNTARIEIK